MRGENHRIGFRKRPWAVGLLTALLSLPSVRAQEEAPPSTSVGETESRSGLVEIKASQWGEDYQIRVEGGNPRARVLFKIFANELRDDFRWAIYKYRPGEKTDRTFWTMPILIELWGDVTDVYRDRDTRLEVKLKPDNRFHIDLAVRIHDGFEEESFRLEMIRALVIEQMLMPAATNPGAFSGEELKPPPWIVHGFDQLIEHRRAGRPSSFYDGALRSGQILDPDELFETESPENLDPLSYAIFRASAAAMIEALLDQPDGDVGIREILADAGMKPDVSVASLMRQHFPAFREMEQGMEKWWVLQVASLGQQQSFEFMDREETERWLTEALTVRFDGNELPELPGKKKTGFFQKLMPKKESPIDREPFAGSIDQYQEFMARTNAEEKLGQCFSELQRLKQAGFPLYRPVFEGYELVIERLMQRRMKEIDAQLAALAEMRATIYDTLVRTEDYMNYYEATRAPQRSKAFDDYLKMRKELDSAPPPRRNDRISRYLDALEVEFP